jgi:polysaccharide biosynthesis/export protein
MLCTSLCGCQTLHYGASRPAEIYCDAGMMSAQPRELDKVTVPTYRIEPPDILTIDVVQNVVQSSYVLQVGDVVAISVSGAFPDEPIADEFLIEAGGLVVLGYGYGSVEIAGRTVQEATVLIEQHLRRQLREPQVSVALRSVAQLQRISGEHLVAADGTISLGQYGQLSVVGLTLDEARYAIASHLSHDFANPQVSVSVYAFNSKVYYIVTQGGGMGDGLVRLPFTGNETVMDALSQINGLSYVSSSRMWIARPQRDGTGNQILPIDWEGITQRAEVRSNYQVLPGDRIFIAHNSWVAFDGALAKLTSPFERVFGFTLLGTGTASRLSGKVLKNQNVVVFSPD